MYKIFMWLFSVKHDLKEKSMQIKILQNMIQVLFVVYFRPMSSWLTKIIMTEILSSEDMS